MKSIQINEYVQRDINLKKLGFAKMSDYIKSTTWTKAKHLSIAYYGDKCMICSNHYWAVHHLNYSLKTLKAKKLKDILEGCIPVCKECHQLIHNMCDKRTMETNTIEDITLFVIWKKHKIKITKLTVSQKNVIKFISELK